MVERILDEERADYCDNLLSKLIKNEKQYDDTITDKMFEVKEYFRNIIKEDCNILLCYQIEGVILGYLLLKPTVHNDLTGYLIDGLYVEEEYRNQGIASSLIKEAIKMAKERKVSYLDINVLNSNENAYRLYKELGFNDFAKKVRTYI